MWDNIKNSGALKTMLKVYPLKNYSKYISEINKIVFDEFKF